MSIRNLELAKKMKAQGARLKRDGLAEVVFCLVDEFNENRSYKNAMVLAGRLKAIAQAAKFDSYWNEKCSTGYEMEVRDLENAVYPAGKLPNGESRWWIK